MTDDLITTLESAPEGSRELDARIWCAKAGFKFIRYDGAGVSYEGSDPKFYGSTHFRDIADIRPYSTSLDAALTLVPEGWVFTISTEWNASCLGVAAHAKLSDRHWPDPQSGDGSIVTEGHSATEALALCAAALQARETGNN